MKRRNNMKISNFIFIDTDSNTNFYAGKKYQYTNTGTLLYPIGSIIPVIRKGKNCIGLAKVLSFMVTEDTTTVQFQMLGKINEASKEAYYALYLQSASFSTQDADDIYENTDQFIPGAMGLGKGNARKSKKKSFFDEDPYDF